MAWLGHPFPHDAVAICRRVAQRQREAGLTPSLLLFYSGGKDALGCLEAARQADCFERIEGVYMYLVKGLEVVEAHLYNVARRYRMRVHAMPHFHLAYLIKNHQWSPAWSEKTLALRIPTFRDMEARAKKLSTAPLVPGGDPQLPINWTAWGWRATDGPHRRGLLMQYAKDYESGIFAQARAPRTFPIWQWNDRQTYAFLRANKVPLPHRLGTFRTSGVGIRPDVLLQIRAEFPMDYARILEVFPYAEALVHRETIRRSKGDAAARSLVAPGGDGSGGSDAGIGDEREAAPGAEVPLDPRS